MLRQDSDTDKANVLVHASKVIPFASQDVSTKSGFGVHALGPYIGSPSARQCQLTRAPTQVFT